MGLPQSRLSRADAEEYTEALGHVVAGGYRLVAHAQRLGVPRALGLSTPEWVEQRLGGYVRMNIPDRRDAVAELSEEGLSTREIGDVLGVNHATAARDAVANATTKSRANAEIESEPVANATPYPDAEDSADGQAMPEHPAAQREQMRQSFYAAAEATARLLVEVEALIESLDYEHRDSAQSTAVQSIDTWRQILHRLERPRSRRAW